MSEKDVIMETAKMLSNYNGQLLNNTQIKISKYMRNKKIKENN
jgi:hypothetical protein